MGEYLQTAFDFGFGFGGGIATCNGVHCVVVVYL